MFHQGPTMELLYGTSTALTGDEEDDDPAPSDDESGNKSGTESATAVAAGPDPPSPAS